MALFNFRKPPAEAASQAPAASPENPELIRRRARQRLMGATVLVVLAVIGLPMLFDSQPRPIPVDIPIDIPDRNKALAPKAEVKPDAKPEVKAAEARPETKVEAKPVEKSSDKAPEKAAEQVAEKPAAPKPEPKAEPKPEPKPESKAEPKTDTKIQAKPEPKAEVKPAAKEPARDDGARALALLEGRGNAADAADTRFVVQVGAYAEADKAREVRLRLERAGLKTYTHVAETKEGKRIRVRLGPFSQRADAERAASKVKGLGLDASVLSL